MSRSLPLISLLLLQLLSLALAQSYITASIDGTLVSWIATDTGAPVATASVSGKKFTFTISNTPSPAPTPIATPGPTHSAPKPASAPTTHHTVPAHPVPTTPATHKTPHHKPRPAHSPHRSHHGHKSGNHNSGGNTAGNRQSGNPDSQGNTSGQHSGSSQQSSSGGGSNHGLAIGLSVGLILAAIAIGAAVWFFLKRRKAQGYASTASSLHEEGKAAPRGDEEISPAYVPTAEPTLPAVVALPSPRNSGSSFVSPVDRVPPTSEVQTNTPWVPKTRSRLSQVPESLASAPPASAPPASTAPVLPLISTSPPGTHSIPRRPVGASSP